MRMGPKHNLVAGIRWHALEKGSKDVVVATGRTWAHAFCAELFSIYAFATVPVLANSSQSKNDDEKNIPLQCPIYLCGSCRAH